MTPDCPVSAPAGRPVVSLLSKTEFYTFNSVPAKISKKLTDKIV